MKITQNVIQDLLPLYLAGEASEDTVALVKSYLETDPELTKIVEKSTANNSLNQIPVPLSKEAEMESYKKANMIMALRTITLAAIISTVFLCSLALIPLIILVFNH